MIIGGFAKNSLIDFPGSIACVVFTQGCNFLCPYCHNPELVTGPVKGSGHLYDETQILTFLAKRKGLLEGVVITGGEPTLQNDLVLFCRKIKAMGYRIKLDTNGTRPKVLASLFKEDLLDYVAMDIKTCPDDYAGVWQGRSKPELISQSVDLIKEMAKDYEFRTTCVRPFVTDETMKQMAQLIKGAKKYILQHCSGDVEVLDPDFLKLKDRFYSQDGMEKLKIIAAQYVKKVTIR